MPYISLCRVMKEYGLGFRDLEEMSYCEFRIMSGYIEIENEIQKIYIDKANKEYK